MGEVMGVVESVKAASDVYSPVTGEIVEINEELPDDPAVINTDPQGAGWWVKIKMSDASELDGAYFATTLRSAPSHFALWQVAWTRTPTQSTVRTSTNHAQLVQGCADLSRREV